MTKNIAASVRTRLLNRAKQTGENYNHLLVRYSIERLLYRLSQSPHANDFILKGANLFYVWTGQLHRPTKDLDMLRIGPTTPTLVEGIIRSCLQIDVVEDGVVFDPSTITTQIIREVELYSGVRVSLKGYIGKAEVKLQLDIGTGDAITPQAEEVKYPSLLDMPEARVKAYRFETVIAEKCEAMVKLGASNTRLKDFYDVYILARDHTFAKAQLGAAIQDTFQRRGTKLPTQTPIAWTKAFGEDSKKTTQWRAFLKKSHLEAPELHIVIEFIESFLHPVIHSIIKQKEPVGHWREAQWHEKGE